MAWVTGVSRLFGLVRSQFMAGLLGATGIADAFNIAFRFPNLMRRLFAEGAMSSGFVPVFTALVEKEGHDSAQRFFSRIVALLSAILIVLTVLVVVLAPSIIDFYYSGQAGGAQAARPLAILLFRLMFPYLIFISLAAILQGVLNTHHEFSIPAAAPIVFNLLVIGSALAYLAFYRGELSEARAIFLSVGVLLGGLGQFLFQVPWLAKKGYRLSFDFRWRDPQVARFLTLVVPTVFSAGVYQLNAMLVDPLAVSLGEGALSAIQYSIRLQEFPLGMVVVSLATVSLPAFSRHVASGDRSALHQSIRRSLLLSSLAMLPVMLFSFFFANEIIRLVYGLGAFDARAVALTGACFSFHIASIWFIGFSRILTNVFFATQDTRSPLFVSIAGLLSNVGFALLLTRGVHWGVSGIAMAGGLSALVMAILYALLLARRGHRIFEGGFLLVHVKLLLALLAPAAALWAIRAHIPGILDGSGLLGLFPAFWKEKISDGLLLALGTLGLVVGYAAALLALRVREARDLWAMVSAKIPLPALLRRGPEDKFKP